MESGSAESERVDRVVRVNASHPDGWEQAAAAAVAELHRTIEDLRVASVQQHRLVIDAGGSPRYALELTASYRVDRRRVTSDGEAIRVHRVLLVANRTAGASALTPVLRARQAAGPTEFHVLVPVWQPSSSASAAWGHPRQGHTEVEVAFAWSAAEQRLARQLRLLADAGAVATGELRAADPFRAVLDVVQRASFDEIVVATLPAAVSRWLRVDLPRRLQRATGLPVTHVLADVPTNAP